MGPVDAVFIGDSWVRKPGTRTWPEQLCRARGWSFINLGKSGAVSADGMDQLARLNARPDLVDNHTLWIIHIGGNDILRKIYKSPQGHAQCVHDMCQTHYSQNGNRKSFSFYSDMSTALALNVRAIVHQARSRFGASRFLISHAPVSHDMPICSAIGSLCSINHGETIIFLLAKVLREKIDLHVGGIPGVIMHDASPYHHMVEWCIDGFHPTDRGHRTLAIAANKTLIGTAEMPRYTLSIPQVSKNTAALSTAIGGAASTVILNIPVFNPYFWGYVLRLRKM